MHKTAMVAFGVVLVLGALFVSVPTKCLGSGVAEQKIPRSASMAPKHNKNSIPMSIPSGSVLTLEKALTRALEQSPKLAVLAMERKARSFETQQAGYRLNPELSIDVENILGDGDFSGTDNAETTVSISQVLELGGKRAKRQALGRTEQELADRAYDIARAEVFAETTDRFIAVLAAHKRLDLAREQFELATTVLKTVEDRISAGKTATIEKLRFQPPLSEARLRQNLAEQELTTARLMLAVMWGKSTPDFERAQGAFEKINPLPAWSDLELRIADSPVLSLVTSVTKQADAVLALARAEQKLDLTLSIGAKNDQDSGNNALVAGLSIPLPFFRRNQGAMAAAAVRLAKGKKQARAERLQLRAEVTRAWQDLRSAHSEVAVLRDEIIPAVRKTFDAATYGYESGKFGSLEVLDAQRSLFDSKNRYTDSLITYHQAVSNIERLIGQRLFSSQQAAAIIKNERGHL